MKKHFRRLLYEMKLQSVVWCIIICRDLRMCDTCVCGWLVRLFGFDEAYAKKIVAVCVDD